MGSRRTALAELKTTSSENGDANAKPHHRWPPTSLFGLVQDLGGTTALASAIGKPTHLVCDDLQDEATDFILADDKKKVVASVHAKASGASVLLFRTRGGVRAGDEERPVPREVLTQRRSAKRPQLGGEALEVPEAVTQPHPYSVETISSVAAHQGRVYLDLADPAATVIEIDADGWRACEHPPVRFRRSPSALALPRPVAGGSVATLRRFLNLPDPADFALLVAWVTAAIRGVGPFPIAGLLGEQGSAKSTTARVLKRLIDPTTAPIRSEPKEARDLMIAARNSWVLSYENLSSLPPWLSDALCSLATGGGFAIRHERRPLDTNEFARLLTAATAGRSYRGLPGPDRRMLYLTAAYTGLRASELASLAPGSFDLDVVTPTVTVAAAYSKHKREDVVPLHPDLVGHLRLWLADRPASALLWPGKWAKQFSAAAMLRKDLDAARRAWVAEAAAAERPEREASDFLAYKDRDGGTADFHALRHGFITALVDAGVMPNEAKELARHSTITLTMDRYAHVTRKGIAAAVAKLPGIGLTGGVGAAPGAADNGSGLESERTGEDKRTDRGLTTVASPSTKQPLPEQGFESDRGQLATDPLAEREGFEATFSRLTSRCSCSASALER
ncbi:tyrosine-type recombinase/integrase [bacterium]|nr:tyrosine-type recombinase/integrase [bacterium]